MTQTNTIDPAEVAKFEAMAAEWWNPNGKFKPLHMLNPCRLDYITSQIAAEFDRNLAGETLSQRLEASLHLFIAATQQNQLGG